MANVVNSQFYVSILDNFDNLSSNDGNYLGIDIKLIMYLGLEEKFTIFSLDQCECCNLFKYDDIVLIKVKKN